MPMNLDLAFCYQEFLKAYKIMTTAFDENSAVRPFFESASLSRRQRCLNNLVYDDEASGDGKQRNRFLYYWTIFQTRKLDACLKF